MAKIKHTKNALKAQREALLRFERFLPMLQLKKMQLQMELQSIEVQVAEMTAREADVRGGLERWVQLFAEPAELAGLTRAARIVLGESNIAGVSVPVFKDVVFERAEPDLFATPTWVDDAVTVLEQLIRNRIAIRVLAEQKRLIVEELCTTSQRVNLFEKVKIPEAREHIRVIKIFLGDQQTAGVARAKFAKGRTADFEESGLMHPAMEETVGAP
jgi:V/A-type H+-transporting ATPase subunit D